MFRVSIAGCHKDSSVDQQSNYLGSVNGERYLPPSLTTRSTPRIQVHGERNEWTTGVSVFAHMHTDCLVATLGASVEEAELKLWLLLPLTRP